jgi:hypothetical protein
VGHVHAHGRGLDGQVLVHDELVAAGLEQVIRLAGLVEGQGQSGSRAPSGGKIDANGGFFLVREILVQLAAGGLGDFDHADDLLG